jgi:hypothetical protein
VLLAFQSPGLTLITPVFVPLKEYAILSFPKKKPSANGDFNPPVTEMLPLFTRKVMLDESAKTVRGAREAPIAWRACAQSN